MTWTWMFGYLLAGILIWIGLSGWGLGIRPSTKQLFVVVGFFVLVLTIALTLDELFHWWVKFPKILVGLAGILIILERCVRVVVARKRGGAAILDLGRVRGPDLIINVFAGVALAWFAIKDVVDIVRKVDWTFEDISIQIFLLSIAFAVFVQAVSKRKLLDHGVLYGTGLSRWEEIESFDWEKESTASSTLVLHKRARGFFSRLLSLSVKLEHVEPVEEVLHQHRIGKTGEAPPA